MLSGSVVSINHDGIFTLRDIDGRDWKCRCTVFCPIMQYDLLIGQGEGDDIITFNTLPLVVPSKDPLTLQCYFCVAWKKWTAGYRKKAKELYDILVTSYPDVTAGLDTLAMNRKADMKPDRFHPIISGFEYQQLLGWWFKNRVLRQIYLFGITLTQIRNSGLTEIEFYSTLLQNAYAIPSLPMTQALEIRQRLQQSESLTEIYCGTMLRKLYSELERKNLCVREESWMTEFPQYLNYKEHWLTYYPVHLDLGHLYLRHVFQAESTVVKWIKNRMTYPLPSIILESVNFEQAKIIQEVLRHDISIIRGPPGSGKSTLISALTKYLETDHKKYFVVSYTGKAVARLRQIIEPGRCVTIHRLLEIRYNIASFRYLIIDEASMVSIGLMAQLLTAWRFPFQVILVGDANQIPQIEWGSLFHQMLKTSVPQFELKTNYRLQDKNDKIGPIANLILRWPTTQTFPLESLGNFQVLAGDLETVYNLLPCFDGKILTPYNTDVDAINRYCQQIRSCETSDWNIGDKVIMTENNYKLGIMNGEEGVIVGLGKQIKIRFGETIHKFNLESVLTDSEESEELHMGMIKLAYALTINRSQGSEWNDVILYIRDHPANSMFLNRNLIYTAITRARNKIWIIGHLPAITAAINQLYQFGFERLAERC